MKTINLFFIGMLCTFPSFSQDYAAISEIHDLVKVGKKVCFLEDVEGNLTMQDILKPENQKKFQKHEQDVFNRQASSSVYWFKFVIQNKTHEDLCM